MTYYPKMIIKSDRPECTLLMGVKYANYDFSMDRGSTFRITLTDGTIYDCIYVNCNIRAIYVIDRQQNKEIEILYDSIASVERSGIFFN